MARQITITILILMWLSSNVLAANKNLDKWSTAAKADIESAYAIAMNDHPGSVDERNPDFNAVMKSAYKSAMSKAEMATNYVQYRQAVRAFFGPFEDYHFTVGFPSDEPLTKLVWAGLIVTPTDDHMTVVATDESLSHFIGQTILSCDDKTPKELYNTRVKPYLAHPDIEATRRGYFSRLFIGRAGQFEPLIKQCIFQGPTGVITYDLDWGFNAEAFSNLNRVSLQGTRPEPGVREFKPGKWWINASNFNPRNAEEQAAIEAMLQAINNQAEQLRTADTIVVDIRGNGGGSSSYGDQIVDAIWGKDYRKARAPESKSYVDWRVSPGNLAHMQVLNEMVIERKFPQDVIDWVKAVQQGMQKASANGDSLYKHIDSNPPEEVIENHEVHNLVKGQILFLTNINCGSACLDFSDVMLSLENVTQIGQPTTADTQYMEIRVESSPSGFASYGIPVKVYRDRIRLPKQAYYPSIRYNGLEWTDEALEEWVIELLQKQ